MFREFFNAVMTKPLSCIIIDDCDLDRKAVENEILNYDQLKIAGSFSNCLEAADFFHKNRPDLLFVDVDMPDINGLDFIRTINQTDSINVIISSHPEYALEGFQLKVFDFILKPLESDRFDSTIQRIEDFIKLKYKAEAYDVLFKDEEILFKEGTHLVKLHAGDILYLEAFGDYTKIVTKEKVHLTLTTLSRFMASLPVNRFIRIHRSYVIAVSKIQKINLKTIDMGIDILPVGKTYIREAKQIFNQAR